jgi:hypothetical protein
MIDDKTAKIPSHPLFFAFVLQQGSRQERRAVEKRRGVIFGALPRREPDRTGRHRQGRSVRGVNQPSHEYLIQALARRRLGDEGVRAESAGGSSSEHSPLPPQHDNQGKVMTIMTTPKCEKCEGRTYLSRREPSPELGPKHELHTFRCAACEHCQSREVELGATS